MPKETTSGGGRGVLRIVSLSTDENFIVQNFEKTAQLFGYEYYFVGRNRKFRGWPWRTGLYIQAIKSLSSRDDDVFVLCDSNDLFFVAPSTEMLNKFVQGGKRVLVGAEAACCNGFYADRKNGHRDKALEACKARVPWSRNRFPNGGFMIGYKKDLLKLLQSNAKEWDDQGGYLQKFMDGSPMFDIDASQTIVGNVPTINSHYFVEGDVHGKPEIDWWVFDESRGRYVSDITGEAPCAFHFPGKSWTPYNIISERLFPVTNGKPNTLMLPFDQQKHKASLTRLGSLLGNTVYTTHQGSSYSSTVLAVAIVLVVVLVAIVIVFVIVALYYANKSKTRQQQLQKQQSPIAAQTSANLLPARVPPPPGLPPPTLSAQPPSAILVRPT